MTLLSREYNVSIIKSGGSRYSPPRQTQSTLSIPLRFTSSPTTIPVEPCLRRNSKIHVSTVKVSSSYIHVIYYTAHPPPNPQVYLNSPIITARSRTLAFLDTPQATATPERATGTSR